MRLVNVQQEAGPSNATINPELVLKQVQSLTIKKGRLQGGPGSPMLRRSNVQTESTAPHLLTYLVEQRGDIGFEISRDGSVSGSRSPGSRLSGSRLSGSRS